MQLPHKSTWSDASAEKPAWQAPSLSRIELTKAEVERIATARDPSAELRRTYLTKRH